MKKFIFSLMFFSVAFAGNVQSLSLDGKSHPCAVPYARVSPNPAYEAITVEWDTSCKTIALYNLVGTIVRPLYITSDSATTIRMTELPTGVYFVRLMDRQDRIVSTHRFYHIEQ